MARFLGGCKSVQEYCYYVHCRVTECIHDHKSKEKTSSYLWDQFQITSQIINIVMETSQNAQRYAAASSSQVSQEAATGNAGDALIPVQQPLSPRSMPMQRKRPDDRSSEG